MNQKIAWGIGLLAAVFLVAPVGGFGQEKAPAPAASAAPTPAPDPKQVLQQMCDFLKNQPQFSFKAEVTDDQVYAGGRKLQYGLDMEAFFHRPNQFRINGSGDVENKQLFFDGKTLTLYDQDRNHYGAIEVGGDIDAALDKAGKDYGVRVGLAELGANRLSEVAHQGLTNALYVGMSKVRGVPCHHLAFDKEKGHYQLWVEAGEKPLLRKVVVLQKELPYAPQWTAYFSDWNFTPTLADNLFTFTPPDGAQKIQFLLVKKAAPPMPRGTKKKKKGGES